MESVASAWLPGAPYDWRGTAMDLVSIENFVGKASFALYPDPVLRVDAAPVTIFDEQLRRVVDAIATTRRQRGAVGLAATQCAIDAQIVVLGSDVFINPCIVHRSDESNMLVWREQCLVLPPDVVVETLRDSSIVVEARSLSGRCFHRTLTGELSRAFLHEYDHARGILIVDHAADVVSSRCFPPMAMIEAPDHDRRRRRAWERSTCPIKVTFCI